MKRHGLEEHGPTAQERQLGREAIARIKAGPLASSKPPRPRQFAGIPAVRSAQCAVDPETVDESVEPESEVY